MRWIGLVVVLSVVGCARDNPLFDDATGSGTDGTSGSNGPTGDPSGGTNLPTAPGSATLPPGESGESTKGESTLDPDSGSDTSEETGIDSTTGEVCKSWGDECQPARTSLDQCPETEKCAPTGDASGYTGGHCVPQSATPRAPGDPCSIECRPWSGIDDCRSGLLCLGDGGGEGTCVTLCDPEDPAAVECTEPGHVCAVMAGGLFGYCSPVCDPLLGNCPTGATCVPNGGNDGWHCEPDGSGNDGGHGDPCEAPSECDPGLTCVPPALVEGCVGAGGCCTEVCDVQNPDNCPLETLCVPFYEKGMAPPDYENVGVCTSP